MYVIITNVIITNSFNLGHNGNFLMFTKNIFYASPKTFVTNICSQVATVVIEHFPSPPKLTFISILKIPVQTVACSALLATVFRVQRL